MSHPGSAPWPPAFAPGQGGPSSIVVEILWVKPNTDLDAGVPDHSGRRGMYGFASWMPRVAC